jgi:sulfide:quinone oxidoreductase
VYPDPDDWKSRTLLHLIDDSQAQLDCGLGALAAQHHRVADRLDLFVLIPRQDSPNALEELRRQVRRPLVAVGLGQRGEAGEVGEYERLKALRPITWLTMAADPVKPGPAADRREERPYAVTLNIVCWPRAKWSGALQNSMYMPGFGLTVIWPGFPGPMPSIIPWAASSLRWPGASILIGLRSIISSCGTCPTFVALVATDRNPGSERRHAEPATVTVRPMGEREHVVIAGGGIAGLEALIALRDLAGDRVALTLVAPDPDFTYKPFTVEEPFSPKPAERRALAPIAEEFGAAFVQEGVTAVDPARHVVSLTNGSELPYDAAVICVGARQVPAYREAATFRTSGEPLAISDLLRCAAETAPKRVAFVASPGAAWPLPVYELALMGKRRALELGLQDLECVIVTPEEAPLIMFGRLASDAVAELLSARRIRAVAAAHVTAVEGGAVRWVPGDGRLEISGAVALPALEGPAIDGLPADEHGFIPIDQHARVRGVERVYAAGDGTTFPIKQGGLATLEADAAAEHIAASIGAPVDPRPFHPVLRGRLLTGDESLSLEADVAGGGEGTTSLDYLWWPPHKVSGRYLPAWLAGEEPRADPAPPRHSLEVEVSLPTEWHREPMALDPYRPLAHE